MKANLPVAIAAVVLSFLAGYIAFGQEPTAIRIPREDAARYLAGECFPRAPRTAPDGLPLVLKQTLDPQEIAHALILALGAVPESRLIEVEDEIPAGFRHLGLANHNGHHPFTQRRIVGKIVAPVRLCDQ